MAQRNPLSISTCDAVVLELFNGILKRKNSLIRKQIALSEAFMFLNMFAFGQATVLQDTKFSNTFVIPPKTLSLFCKKGHIEDVISAIYEVSSQGIDGSGLIGLLFRSLYSSLTDGVVGGEKAKFKESLGDFAEQFIRKSLQHQSLRLPSKYRTAICLAAFDVICSCKKGNSANELSSKSHCVCIMMGDDRISRWLLRTA